MSERKRYYMGLAVCILGVFVGLYGLDAADAGGLRIFLLIGFYYFLWAFAVGKLPRIVEDEHPARDVDFDKELQELLDSNRTD